MEETVGLKKVGARKKNATHRDTLQKKTSAAFNGQEFGVTISQAFQIMDAFLVGLGGTTGRTVVR